MSQLPVADRAEVRAYARDAAGRHRRELARMLVLYALAAVTALVPAWIIGHIINVADGAPT